MFFGKMIKWTVLSAGGAILLGGFVFGRDLYSYVTTSTRAVQTAVRDSVPVEFELRRARDLVEDILPEMQANIRLIAQQEVEIENLRTDITRSEQSLGEERVRLVSLRAALDRPANATFAVNGVNYSRDEVRAELARRLQLTQEAETILAGKKRLLENRSRSLEAAVQALNRTRQQKELLQAQIASLESQHRLVVAAANNTSLQIDDSKLSQSQRLIAQIRERLDVAERVLAHESRFVAPIQVNLVNEADLLQRADEYLAVNRAGNGGQ
jgi:flagellar biosynthesis chaperone FliJ